MIGKKELFTQRSSTFVCTLCNLFCIALVNHTNNIQVLVHSCQTRKKSQKAKPGKLNIIPSNFFYGDIPNTLVFTAPVPVKVNELKKVGISDYELKKLASVIMSMLQIIWCECYFHLDIVHMSKGSHIEQLQKVQIKS